MGSFETPIETQSTYDLETLTRTWTRPVPRGDTARGDTIATVGAAHPSIAMPSITRRFGGRETRNARGTRFASPGRVEHLYSSTIGFGKELWKELKKDELTTGAAALAFYLVLALFPAAIFGLSLLPYLPIPRLEQAIMDLVRQALPGPAADMLTGTVKSVVSRRSGGLLSFGFVFALWSASKGMHAMMRQLNRVYDVEEKRSFFRAHGTAVLLTVMFFVLVVGALGLIVFGGVAQSYIGAHFGWSTGLRVFFAGLRWVIIVAALQLALSLVYHFAPHHEDRRFVFFSCGSVFATGGLLATSVAFKLYVSHFGNYQAVYGSLGAIIVLLMWLFAAGWVILVGAEINDLRGGSVDAVGRQEAR